MSLGKSTLWQKAWSTVIRCELGEADELLELYFPNIKIFGELFVCVCNIYIYNIFYQSIFSELVNCEGGGQMTEAE